MSSITNAALRSAYSLNRQHDALQLSKELAISLLEASYFQIEDHDTHEADELLMSEIQVVLGGNAHSEVFLQHFSELSSRICADLLSLIMQGRHPLHSDRYHFIKDYRAELEQ